MHMHQDSFRFPFKRHFAKSSTWLFVLATILLHIMLLESASWKVLSPSPTPEFTPTVTVHLRPDAEVVTPAQPEPPSEKPIVHSRRKPTTTTKSGVDTIAKPVENSPELIEKEPEIQEANHSSVVEMPVTPDEIALPSDAAATPAFSLSFPKPAELQMEVSHTKVNASPTTGVGVLMWERMNEKYKISIEVGMNLLITTLNLLTITSEGYTDIYGLMPVLSQDIRKTRAATAIHFNHQDKTISFSSSNKKVAMENGAQDAASILMQLGAIGAADANQLAAGKEFSIQVAEGRDATPFLFRVIGEEEIDSKLDADTGKLMTVHITRPPKPGFYNSQLDIWLAPSLGWYPVQIRNTESNGTVTNQVVTMIKQKFSNEN